MSTLQDTDLLLINRAGVEYKCTFADFKKGLLTAPDVGAITLADVAGGARFTSVAFPISTTMTNNGSPISTKKLKAYVEGSLKSAAQTSAITLVNHTVMSLPNSTSKVIQLKNNDPKDLAYLTRTLAFAGNQQRMTFSFWLKMGTLGQDQNVFTGGLSTKIGSIRFTKDDKLELVLNNGGGKTAKLTTTRVFNDTSAWYHFVVVFDSTNAMDLGRWRVYVNGVKERAFDTAHYPEQDVVWGGINGTEMQGIGMGVDGLTFDGFLADIYFIDGQDRTATDFGEKDAKGVWKPKAYTGNYGLTGYHLDGKVKGNVGKDAAGSHDWSNPGDKVSTVNATTLTFADNTQLANVAKGDVVTEVGHGNDGHGTVNNIDTTANTIELSPTAGTWEIGSALKGPLKTPAAGASVKLYCKLDAAGVVSDLQSADPGFTAWTPTGTGTVTFPARLPTGDPPDTDLPAGTTITVEVEASNLIGSDSAKSNTLTPA